jgi:hypothetical protein
MPDKPRYFSTIPTNVVAFQFPADPEDAKHFITEVSQILIPAVDRHPFSSFAVTPHDNSIAIPKKGEGNVRFYPGDDSFAGEVLKEALLELPEEKEAEYDDKEELEAAAISLATASGQRWIDLSPGERESLRSSARATADNRRQSKPGLELLPSSVGVGELGLVFLAEERAGHVLRPSPRPYLLVRPRRAPVLRRPHRRTAVEVYLREGKARHNTLCVSLTGSP